jgi:hypothetical protein
VIRTTPELVAGLVQVDSNITLDPFISAASILTDRVAAESNSPDDNVLQVIETWLAAHFYCVRNPRRSSERAGDVWATFMSKVDLNLQVTHYGQQAMMLDPTGVLKFINDTKAFKARKVGATWMGCE